MSVSPRVEESESDVFRKYYTENDFFLSLEGILKVLSVMVCIVSAVLFLGGAGGAGGACRGAPALAAGSGTVSLVCAGGVALLCAAVALDLPLAAPQTWLYIDVIVSSVLGVLLLLTAALTVFICEFRAVVDYFHGPLALVNAGMVTGSAAVTYASVMRQWDAATRPPAPRAPAPTEQEV